MVVSYAGIVVWDFLGRRLHFKNDHDVREDDDACWEDEAEEENGQHEALARHRGLSEPPVQGARGPKRLRGVVAPANQRHGGPEGHIHPDKGQADEGVVAF